MPANSQQILMANFDSEFIGLVFPGFQATQKIHAQNSRPELSVFLSNFTFLSPKFIQGDFLLTGETTRFALAKHGPSKMSGMLSTGRRHVLEGCLGLPGQVWDVRKTQGFLPSFIFKEIALQEKSGNTRVSPRHSFTRRRRPACACVSTARDIVVENQCVVGLVLPCAHVLGCMRLGGGLQTHRASAHQVLRFFSIAMF